MSTSFASLAAQRGAQERPRGSSACQSRAVAWLGPQGLAWVVLLLVGGLASRVDAQSSKPSASKPSDVAKPGGRGAGAARPVPVCPEPVAVPAAIDDPLADEFREQGDCWLAVNASSHFRKAGESGRADQVLGGIKLADNAPRKLRSALCTTHGGVMRDLERWDDALRLGQDAHALTPKDYRPCTLLGAVYMETSRYDLGQLWYAKAVERGANERDVDNDLRNIYQRANRDKKAALSAFLIRLDPQRYAWARLPK